MHLPTELVIPVVGGLVAAIGVLWKRLLDRDKRIEQLNDSRATELLKLVAKYSEIIPANTDAMRENTATIASIQGAWEND